MEDSRLKSILENPFVNLVVGIIMFASSFGHQGSLYYDFIMFNWNAHHGLNIAGLWRILHSLTNIYKHYKREDANNGK